MQPVSTSLKLRPCPFLENLQTSLYLSIWIKVLRLVVEETRSSPSTNDGYLKVANNRDSSPASGVVVENKDDSVPGIPPRVKHIKKLYGSQSPLQLGGDKYDYENIYGDDPMYEELKPNARVWKVYNDEMDKLDNDRVEDWRDGLDALLILGALFSAVLTTFVVETYSRLDFDWAEVSANLLAESVALQRAAMAGIPVGEVPASPLTPSLNFHAKPLDVALNALWFLDLVMSLGAALSAVVAKQWIHQYIAIPTGTPQERARIRHFRFLGLEKWHMSLIIGLLPMCIHLSMALFLMGLLLLLHESNLVIAVIVDVLAFTIMSLYLVSNLLPVWFLDCPYQTPLTSLMFHLF
ncbi:hypothetical protein D9757_014886 [Collybiopsis confluens]|uniref:DUF6535 domain-containing protein n=1 Tax=Collybiopsis confluens TaxID=2823264 RepID=A0A8H5CMH5_9AGAR|nr:hypothetical protein D9757_014886 [Collybiopsis confluens]